MKSVTRLSYVITEHLLADEICDPSYLRDYRRLFVDEIILLCETS